MRIISRCNNKNACVATIGSFDGVHEGHRFVISQVISRARQKGLDSLVVTFSNHPLQVLRPDFRPLMLTLAEEKEELLIQTGIDKVAMIEFTQELASMTAYDFMKSVLHDELNVRVLIIGYDNHFGHDGKSFNDYVAYGQQLGIEVVLCDALDTCPRPSSTAVRNALISGEVDTANILLGYRFFIRGYITTGFQNGRKIGFPTANVIADSCKLIPKNGVYMVHTSYGLGMLNIGCRPTFDNGDTPSIEVHIFDFDDNLYDKPIKIDFIHRLRDERHFDSLDALRQQLLEDEAFCRQSAKKG